MINIYPSIASCDQLHIAEAIDSLKGLGSLHIDVEDGNFIPNITFGKKTISSIRKYTDLPMNFHFMVSNPFDYMELVQECAASDSIAHIESLAYPLDYINRLKRKGIRAGLALNFATPVSSLAPFADSLDSVMIMTSEADGGEQLFSPYSLKRIAEARALMPENVRIWADGGIGKDTISQVISAGADSIVLGRAIWKSPDPAKSLKYFEQNISYAIFDMDGLMFDTENLFVTSYEQYVSSITGTKYPREKLIPMLGSNDEYFSANWNKVFGPGKTYEECRVIGRKWRSEYIEKNGLPVKRGLKELLAFLKAHKIPMAVASGTRCEKTKHYLEIAGVRDYFDVIVGGDMVTKSKPDPETFNKAARALGCMDNSEAVVLEDSENGLMGAFNGGFRSIIIPDLSDPTIKHPGQYTVKLNSLAEAVGYLAPYLKTPER